MLEKEREKWKIAHGDMIFFSPSLLVSNIFFKKVIANEISQDFVHRHQFSGTNKNPTLREAAKKFFCLVDSPLIWGGVVH